MPTTHQLPEQTPTRSGGPRSAAEAATAVPRGSTNADLNDALQVVDGRPTPAAARPAAAARTSPWAVVRGEPLRRGRAGRAARRGRGGQPGVQQPDRGGRPASRASGSLDLGSGGGIDVLLSARRVGDTGFAYGVDMTDEMLDLARANAAKASATNVEFLKGTIEGPAAGRLGRRRHLQLRHQPVGRQGPGARRDVPGADAGHRIGISDVIAEDDSPQATVPRGSFVGCIAGSCPAASTDGLAGGSSAPRWSVHHEAVDTARSSAPPSPGLTGSLPSRARRRTTTAVSCGRRAAYPRGCRPTAVAGPQPVALGADRPVRLDRALAVPGPDSGLRMPPGSRRAPERPSRSSPS